VEEGGKEVKKLDQFKESDKGITEEEKEVIVKRLILHKNNPMYFNWRGWKNLDERGEFIVRAVFGLTEDGKRWKRNEIAKELDISVESVKKALDRALYTLFPEVFRHTEYNVKKKF